jgi:hypothetical protein
MGRRQGWFGLDFFDDEGKVSPFAWSRARAGAGGAFLFDEMTQPGGARYQPGTLDEEHRGIEREIAELLRGPAEALQEAAKEIREAAGTMKGGPTMVPVTEDN